MIAAETRVSREREFRDLYEDHGPAVRAYLARRVEPDNVDDLAANTFMIAWRRLPGEIEDPLPWLYGVARNEVRAHRRRLAGRQRLTEKLMAFTPRDAARATERAARARSRLRAANRQGTRGDAARRLPGRRPHRGGTPRGPRMILSRGQPPAQELFRASNQGDELAFRRASPGIVHEEESKRDLASAWDPRRTSAALDGRRQARARATRAAATRAGGRPLADVSQRSLCDLVVPQAVACCTGAAVPGGDPCRLC
jgi:hypothetical protein